jgi:tetratricopeptide (TPR) repeat protein
MFLLKKIDRRPIRKIGTVTKGNPLHLHSVVGHHRFGTEAVSEGSEQAVARLIEQLHAPDRRLLGLTALLGVEVSIHEVARLAEISPTAAAASLFRATTLGIIIERPGDRVSFVHERGRDAALAFLEQAERLTAHAQAARLLTGPAPAGVLRRAHHAFAAARRSTEDAVTATQIARQAAAVLQAAEDFEQAAGLLRRAVELHEAAALAEPAAALVVEWAEAVLACGQLAEARPLFDRAIRLAEAGGDSVLFARAALGFGGMWVREHRLTEEAERIGALQRRALEALPPEATALRTRLTVRLAAEQAYRGGSVTTVVAGVEAARRTGDARALAEALSLCHHALLTPEHSNSRLAVANELITVASVAGERFLSLIGLCWRAADLFLLGDPSANVALAELRLRADTLRCRSILFIVRAMEVMLAIRAGQFPQAEQAATVCYELGSEVGDADALAYYGAHLAAIRVFQGREAELADLAASIATSPTLTERDRAFALAAALFALRGGHPHQARARLECLRRDGLHSIMRSSSWLLALLAIVELAAALKDEGNAQAAYNVLSPYAELPIMASLAIVCFGSVHRPLAMAALTCGKIDLAIEHFVAAVVANERLGHRPAATQARAELALALRRRSRPGDRQQSQDLIEEAIAEANTLRMIGLVTRWREALTATNEGTVGTESHLVSVSSAPQGGWRLALGHHIATVPNLVGMRYLARLVAEPNRDVSALALVVGQEPLPSLTGRQEVLDAAAVTAIRERIRTLRQQPLLAPEEQDELAALTHEFACASGLAGRSRAFADVPERARTAVRKAVKRAIEQVSAANPVVGQHLAARIETGAVCRYRVAGHEGN